MRVSLLYFGVLKELAGQPGTTLELPDNATVASVLHAVPGLNATVWKSLAVAVNREYAALGTVLRDGDEVALLPPVSGGCPPRQVPWSRPWAPGFRGAR